MAVLVEPVTVPNGTAAPQFIDSKKHSSSARPAPVLDIIDIRQTAVEINLKEEIRDLFQPKSGPRQLPTLLLYDERGLQLFEDITYLEEYYLTNDEIEVLKTYSAEIANKIPDGSMVVELGSGNLRKISLLLQAIENTGKRVDYYALDLSRQELERTLAQLPSYSHVRAHGLLGTYDDGRAWLKEPINLARQKFVLTMGSSIGNFHREDASEFLRGFADTLSPGDHILVGLDGCNDPAKVYHAYNDHKGITHQFILNGLEHANRILGTEAFKIDEWQVIGEYIYDIEGGRHHALYSPIRDTVVMGELIKSHERIQVEQSLKYSKLGAEKLWNQAGLVEVEQWKHRDEYGIHLLSKPKMPFSLLPSVYASQALPTVEDWEGLWAAWDLVTRGMLPHDELLEKPIKLRNACIFYLGHIPTFADIQLTKTTKTPPTDPASYYSIFERGIDPDVDNPELCHAHSEIPDEWPPVEEILSYQERVRSRIKALYAKGADDIPRNVGQAIWVAFEHEIMHLETLLYMMLQSDKTLPPSQVHTPDFEGMAKKARASRLPNQWFSIPAQEIAIGMNDPESSTETQRHFGWDNEKPPRRVRVHTFEAQARPITNEEYARYLHSTNTSKIPASWAESEIVNQEKVNGSNGVANGANAHSDVTTAAGDDNAEALPKSFLEGKSVRTVYGLVPLDYALDWPIFASFDELAGCAAWMGGRIPSFEEARSIYTHVNVIRKKQQAERKLGRTVPAVNGHLVNNGVEETPPLRDQISVDGESQTHAEAGDHELFADLDGANVGFQHWHPVPVTAGGDRLAGQAEMGGVWEWTSTILRPHEGFEALPLYPGYTADFFDEKHNIVLGGSWATHPRIAGRRSFVNWYQRNYLYAWVGARLVRDAK